MARLWKVPSWGKGPSGSNFLLKCSFLPEADCFEAGNGAGQGLLSARFSSTTNGMQTLPTADHHPLKARPARRTTEPSLLTEPSELNLSTPWTK